MELTAVGGETHRGKSSEGSQLESRLPGLPLNLMPLSFECMSTGRVNQSRGNCDVEASFVFGSILRACRRSWWGPRVAVCVEECLGRVAGSGKQHFCCSFETDLDLAIGLRKPPVNRFPGTPRHIVPTLPLLNNSEVSKLSLPRRQVCGAHYLQ